jgi:hypothetical protein
MGSVTDQKVVRQNSELHMIINHQYKFIFIKTTKTAGTSLEIALSKFSGSHDVVTPIAKEDEITRRSIGGSPPRGCRIPLKFYSKIDLLKSLAGRGWKQFKNHSTAAYIRDNVDPYIWNNYFKFSIERNPYDKAISRYCWSTKINGSEESILEFLDRIEATKLSNWDIYTINDKMAVDYVLRYEHLEQELQDLSKRLGLPCFLESLPRAKGNYRKDKRHFSELLNSAAKERIEVVCAKEIRYFGFEWS